MKFKWQLRPVPTKLNITTMWEHTPLDYYKYGEYPRFINPVRPAGLETEWVKVYEDGTVRKAGEPYAEIYP